MDRKATRSGSNSELRIILLGFKETGKSSAGNTILGSNEFDLKKFAECVKKEGMVSGRQVCVIETPGRREDDALFTPRLCLREAARSVTLCPPGPHAILLVMKSTGSFSEASRETVVEHLKLFGETVWNHILVLFTHGDQLEHKDIQQYIECEGEPLKWVLDKCGSRLHVFNNKVEGDSTQVAELLEKIDEMVTGNQGSHFELDKERLDLISEKQREYEDLKKRKEQQDLEYIKSLKGKEHKLTEQRIILVGQESAGKTSTADNILDSGGSDMKTTLLSRSRDAPVGRWKVTVVDTPGWLRDAPRSQTPKRIKLEIVKSLSACSPGPHAFLLIIPANTTFTEADEMAINEHLQLLGEHVWDHTIVLFTLASWMGETPIELYIASEGEPLNRILTKCGNRYHFLSNMGDDRSQVENLLEKIEVMAAGNFYEMDEKSQEDLDDEGNGDENEDVTGVTYALPSDDPAEVLGPRKTGENEDSSIIVEPSEYSAMVSECGTTDSIEGDRAFKTPMAPVDQK